MEKKNKNKKTKGNENKYVIIRCEDEKKSYDLVLSFPDT
jgi:hypothetical protein